MGSIPATATNKKGIQMFKFYRKYKDYSKIMEVIDASRTNEQLNKCYLLVKKFKSKWNSPKHERFMVGRIADRRKMVSEIERLAKVIQRERKIYEQETSSDAKGQSV